MLITRVISQFPFITKMISTKNQIMKIKSIFLLTFLLSVSFQIFPQNASQQIQNTNSSVQTESQLNQINENLTNITKSLNTLTQGWKKFFDTFNSNQGIRLSEKQQQLLLAFEILNRAEQRIVNLQKLKLEFTEKQTNFRLQLARINDDSLPESIDRYVSTRGTTNAEQLREIRRQALYREKNELTNALRDIENDLEKTNDEIRQTEQFVRNIRQRLFPQIEKELSDL